MDYSGAGFLWALGEGTKVDRVDRCQATRHVVFMWSAVLFSLVSTSSPGALDDAGPGTFRRADHRGRAVRHRRRLAPAKTLSSKELRHSGAAGAHRRDVGPLPLSPPPGPLRHAAHRVILPPMDAYQINLAGR